MVNYVQGRSIKLVRKTPYPCLFLNQFILVGPLLLIKPGNA